MSPTRRQLGTVGRGWRLAVAQLRSKIKVKVKVRNTDIMYVSNFVSSTWVARISGALGSLGTTRHT